MGLFGYKIALDERKPLCNLVISSRIARIYTNY
jgi:hypothetical protein